MLGGGGTGRSLPFIVARVANATRPVVFWLGWKAAFQRLNSASLTKTASISRGLPPRIHCTNTTLSTRLLVWRTVYSSYLGRIATEACVHSCYVAPAALAYRTDRSGCCYRLIRLPPSVTDARTAPKGSVIILESRSTGSHIIDYW